VHLMKKHLVRVIAAAPGAEVIVADDKSSDGSVDYLKKNFPKAKIITLTENFRSTQTILDASYLLIQNNNPNRLEIVEKIDKKLKSKTGTREEKIELIHALRADDEADEIAKKIEELSKKYDYKDIAVLVRANNHAASITTALQRHRIPYQFLGPGYLFQQEEIKDLIAYITFLTNLTDTISLFRVLSMDIFNIPYIELNYLLNFAKKKNLSLFESLYELNQTFLKEETIKKLCLSKSAKFRYPFQNVDGNCHYIRFIAARADSFRLLDAPDLFELYPRTDHQFAGRDRLRQRTKGPQRGERNDRYDAMDQHSLAGGRHLHAGLRPVCGIDRQRALLGQSDGSAAGTGMGGLAAGGRHLSSVARGQACRWRFAPVSMCRPGGRNNPGLGPWMDRPIGFCRHASGRTTDRNQNGPWPDSTGGSP